MQDGTVLVQQEQDLDQDPLVIANQLIGQDLDHNPVVLVIDNAVDDRQFLVDEFMQAGEDFDTVGEESYGESRLVCPISLKFIIVYKNFCPFCCRF